MHGKGLLTYENGNTYEGEFVKNRREGYGSFSWVNGKKFEGHWKNGKQHGRGTCYRNGKNWKVQFDNGKRVELFS